MLNEAGPQFSIVAEFQWARKLMIELDDERRKEGQKMDVSGALNDTEIE